MAKFKVIIAELEVTGSADLMDINFYVYARLTGRPIPDETLKAIKSIRVPTVESIRRD